MSAIADGAGRRAVRRRRRVSAATSGRALDALAFGYVVVVLVLVSAIVWPMFATPRVALIAGVTGIVGLALAYVARARRWSFLRRVGVIAAVFIVGVVPLAVPSAMTSPVGVLLGLRDGIVGIVLGWKQLLTLDLPVGDYQAVLVPFFVVVLVGSSAVAGCALSASRVAELAVPVALACGVFGIAFSATDAGAPASVAGVTIPASREVLCAGLLVVASVVWLSLRARLRRRAALALARSSSSTVATSGSRGVATRRRVLGAVIVAVALVAGIAAVPATSGVTLRSTLRTGSEPQLVLSEQHSPLTTYRAAFATTGFGTSLFRVSGDTDGIDRIPMAVLGDWNGQVFTTGSSNAARFTRVAGGSAPANARAVTITVQKSSGIWMPLPSGVQSAPVFSGNRASALSAAFYLDRDSGAGIDVVGSGSSRGLHAGDSYRVQVPASSNVVLGTPATSGTVSARAYPQLAAWVKAQSQPRTAAGLETLISRLRDRGYLSHSLENNAQSATWIAALKHSASSYTFQSSYAGHSRSRIESLFQQLNDRQKYATDGDESSALVAAIGDDEQFAVAGALLARYLGFDSRVVLGVRTRSLHGSGVPACSRECGGKNLAAWIQVKSPTSAVWTTMDVEPQYAKHPVLVHVGEQLPKNPTVPEQNQAGTAQSPSNQHDGKSVTSHTPQRTPVWQLILTRALIVLGAALLFILFLLLPFLVLLFAKRVRRRRRRAAPVPEVAVLGAWAETYDAWTDAAEVAHGATRTAQAASVGTPEAIRLAFVVDAAVFAEHPPTREAVDEAWALGDAERQRLMVERGIWRRIVFAVRPRSLLRPLFPKGRTRFRTVLGRVRSSFTHEVEGRTGFGASTKRTGRERTSA